MKFPRIGRKKKAPSRAFLENVRIAERTTRISSVFSRYYGDEVSAGRTARIGALVLDTMKMSSVDFDKFMLELEIEIQQKEGRFHHD